MKGGVKRSSSFYRSFDCRLQRGGGVRGKGGRLCGVSRCKRSDAALEWGEVCRQVAHFCSTPEGPSTLLRGQGGAGGGLVRAQTLEECHRLLHETTVFIDAGFLKQEEGFRPTGYIWKKAEEALVTDDDVEQVTRANLELKELYAVLSTLDAAAGIASQVAEGMGEVAYLCEGIGDAEGSLRERLRCCVPLEGLGRLLDGASDTLKRLREEERSIGREVARVMKEVAHTMRMEKRTDGVLRATTYGSYSIACFAVESRVLNVAFEGGVVVGRSGSGATGYVQPAEVRDLNNAKVAAQAAAEFEERRILRALSREVGEAMPRIRNIMQCVTEIDLVNARARYSAWLGGTAPAVEGSGGETGATAGVDIKGTCHPLILAQSLPSLPKPPFWPDERKKELGLEVEGGGWAGGQQANVISSKGAAFLRARERGESFRTTEEEGDEGDDTTNLSLVPDAPIRIDFAIPAQSRLVVISGPNAGGKTAALKTLGLCSLMVQAGIFPPSTATPTLPFFSSVFADIGDDQSLRENLSTFSGHMQRLAHILRNAAGDSLVLMDEIGSGTDPVEGSAIAQVAMQYLMERARLTVATTHYDQLKEMADGDPRVLNASPAMDEVTLQSSYTLRWGVPGQSHAFALARRMGLSSDIIAMAREMEEDFQIDKAGAKRREFAASLKDRRSAAKVRLERAVALQDRVLLLRDEMAEQTRDLDLRVEAIEADMKEKSRERIEAVQTEMAARLEGLRDVKDIDSFIKELEGNITDYQKRLGEDGEESWIPKPGDKVTIPQLHRNGEVVKVGGQDVTVDLGKGSMTLHVRDILPR